MVGLFHAFSQLLAPKPKVATAKTLDARLRVQGLKGGGRDQAFCAGYKSSGSSRDKKGMVKRKKAEEICIAVAFAREKPRCDYGILAERDGMKWVDTCYHVTDWEKQTLYDASLNL